jgi:hypothetical protein
MKTSNDHGKSWICSRTQTMFIQERGIMVCFDSFCFLSRLSILKACPFTRSGSLLKLAPHHPFRLTSKAFHHFPVHPIQLALQLSVHPRAPSPFPHTHTHCPVHSYRGLWISVDNLIELFWWVLFNTE